MLTGADWWQTRRFAAAAMLLACVPLLWPTLPPLTDALGHLGRYRVMLDGGTSALSTWYSFRWHLVGNMGVDLLVAGLAPLIGLEPALKLVTIAIPALTVGGCLALSRAVHGRVSPYTLFALPIAYSQPFHMGFLNFALAMALALFALAAWLSMTPGRRRSTLFVATGLIIWTCHVFGWAVLVLSVAAVELARCRSLPRAALACWPLAAPLLLMVASIGGEGGRSAGFLDIQAKLLAMLMTFRDHGFVWDVLSLAVVVAAIVHGVRRELADRRVAAAAVALLAAVLLLPGTVMGSAFADMRAAPYVLLLALVALRPADARAARTVALVAALFCIARLVSTTASFATYAARQEHLLTALLHMPVGGRVAMLVEQNCDDPWVMSRLEHVGGVATARRRVFVNDGFQASGASLLAIHYPQARPFERDPSQFLPCDGGASLQRRIAALPRTAFDQLWLVNVSSPPTGLPSMVRVWHDRRDALYALR